VTPERDIVERLDNAAQRNGKMSVEAEAAAEIRRLRKELEGVRWGRDQNAADCERMDEEILRLRRYKKSAGHRAVAQEAEIERLRAELEEKNPCPKCGYGYRHHAYSFTEGSICPAKPKGERIEGWAYEHSEVPDRIVFEEGMSTTCEDARSATLILRKPDE